jgi:hypothetical protein
MVDVRCYCCCVGLEGRSISAGHVWVDSH